MSFNLATLRYGFRLAFPIFVSVAYAQLPDNWKDLISTTSGNSAERYNPNLFEGDIMGFRTTDQNLEAANAVDSDKLRWPNNTVPYEIGVGFRIQEKQIIVDAMSLITRMTGRCVRFTERKNEEDYIYIVRSAQCASAYGRTGGRQELSLTPGCLEKHGDIQHELMHALGFYHEHSREDRDNHIIINWENIQKGNRRHFDKRSGRTFGLPYDYESVLHYKVSAFADNEDLPTIVPKIRAQIGQNKNLSPLDVVRIHKLYKCSVPSPASFLDPEPGWCTKDCCDKNNCRAAASTKADSTETYASASNTETTAVPSQLAFKSPELQNSTTLPFTISDTIAITAETRPQRNRVMETQVLPQWEKVFGDILLDGLSYSVSKDFPFRVPITPDGRSIRQVAYTISGTSAIAKDSLHLEEIKERFRQFVLSASVQNIWAVTDKYGNWVLLSQPGT